jgi:hypothetical protein
LPRVSIQSLRQPYISLAVAAAIVYRAFRDPREQPPRTDEELEKLMDESARAVSIALPVYRLDLADAVQIPAGTLIEGRFINGGRSLQFCDGRPPIDFLGVNRIDLDHALSKRAHIVPESRPEAIIPSKFSRPKLIR